MQCFVCYLSLIQIYVYQTDGIFQNADEVAAYYEKYYWNADHSGPQANNILPAPQEAATNTLRPGARNVVDLTGDGAITKDDLYYAGDLSLIHILFLTTLRWKNRGLS